MSSNVSLKGAAPIRVAVCHRDPLLRLGVCVALQSDARFAVGNDTHAADHAFGGVGAIDASVLVADYDTGLAMARRHPDGRGPRTLVLTQMEGECEVAQALAQGVQGYVLAGCEVRELVEGILALARGQRYLTQAVAQRMAERMLHQPLTARELDVLHLVAAGHSNKVVAHQLSLALGTVKCHVKSILEKLGAASRTQAALVARQRGLTRDHGLPAPLPANWRAAPRDFD